MDRETLRKLITGRGDNDKILCPSCQTIKGREEMCPRCKTPGETRRIKGLIHRKNKEG